VAVLEQVADGAEVDHGARVARTAAQLASRTTLSVVSGSLTYCSATASRLAAFDHASL
jgi:hypothetical protein